MSKLEIVLCGCCERVLEDRAKNGLHVVIKSSKGGWGQSKTLFDNGLDEICDSCYEDLIHALGYFVNNWKARQGTNYPKEIKL